MQRRARREDNVETPERAICEPGTVRGHQKLGGKERTGSPQRDPSCRHLGCRFVAPRSEGQLCHLFKPQATQMVALCCGSSRKVMRW